MIARLNTAFYLMVIMLLLCICSGCTSTADTQQIESDPQRDSIQITDSLNRSITLDRPAERIVTFDAQSPEILILLGAQDAVVGIKDTEALIPLQNQLPHAQIVGSTNPDYEKIATLHPDIVIVNSMMDSDKSILTRLMMLNLSVVSLETYGSGMPDSILKIGEITGKTENAEKFLTFYRDYDNLVTDRVQNRSQEKRPLVYWEQSYGTSYVTVGPGSGAYTYLKKLDVRNVADDLTVASPRISPEWLIEQDPDVIIKCGGITQYHEIINRPGLSDISAIKNNRVYVVNTSIMYGPRDVIGRIYLAKIFYLDLFSDIDPDRILDYYSEEYVSGTNSSSPIYPQI